MLDTEDTHEVTDTFISLHHVTSSVCVLLGCVSCGGGAAADYRVIM